MRKEWSEKETKKFIMEYPNKSQEELSQIFGRSISSMETKAHKLGIKKKINISGKKIFLEKEIKKIIKMSEKYSIPEIGKKLKRDKGSLYSLFERLKINNPKSDFWWTKTEVEFLVKNYQNNTREFLEENLNKNWKTIGKKARLLKLKRVDKKGKVFVASVPLSESQKLFILENYEYLTLVEIGRKINRSVDGLKSFYKLNGLKEFRTRKILSDYSDEHLLSKLKEIGENLGRTPNIEDVKNFKELPSINTYYDRFGSFSNACELIGMIPSGGNYGQVCYSKNGDRCFSAKEQFITNFFIENNIKYEKEKKYSELVFSLKDRIRMDWYLTEFDVVVEFFGLDDDDYNKKTKRKIKICKDNEIKMIPLFIEDVKNLNSIFYIYIK